MPQHEGTIDHAWEVASNVTIPERAIKRALLRRTYRVPAETVIDVLEIVCVKCRRPFEDVAGETCVDADGPDATQHLRGGPIGTRKRRKPLPVEADYRAQGLRPPQPASWQAMPEVHPWDRPTGS